MVVLCGKQKNNRPDKDDTTSKQLLVRSKHKLQIT